MSQRVPVLDSIPIDNWVFIYNERNFTDAETMYENMVKAAPGYGMSI
jgi:hypothetical protein